MFKKIILYIKIFHNYSFMVIGINFIFVIATLFIIGIKHQVSNGRYTNDQRQLKAAIDAARIAKVDAAHAKTYAEQIKQNLDNIEEDSTEQTVITEQDQIFKKSLAKLRQKDKDSYDQKFKKFKKELSSDQAKRALYAKPINPQSLKQLAKNAQIVVIAVHDPSSTEETDDRNLFAICEALEGYNQANSNQASMCADYAYWHPSSPYTNFSVEIEIADQIPPTILILNAYNNAVWDVHTKSKNIKAIILTGYESQKIKGLPFDIPVFINTYEESFCRGCIKLNYPYFYSYQLTEKLKKSVKEITGKDDFTFQGGYHGSYFYIQ
ncbi:hypothetical protein [Alkanindiges illinoisensis]|uniref:hypothetical protein n=1 Tax=Alkanindiges illinoisensis TaxID=197183 RepID=UPI00047B4299|nr:hypothetical protein [Alkanindiges illinoisensis]